MLSNSTARMPRLIASAMRNTSLFPMVAFGASPSDDVAVSWGIFFSSTAAMRSNAALIFRAVSAASDLVIGVARSRCDTTRRDIRGSKERYGDVQSFAYEMQTLHAKLKICLHLLSVGFMRREATDGFMRLLSKVRRPFLYTDTKDSHTLHAPHTSRSASTDNIHRIHVESAFFVSDNQRVSANIHNRPHPYPIPTAHTP